MSKEMRGLTQFIGSIRSAENKEEEQQRINKELANIRAKFVSNSQLTDYDKRKYVLKLVYMYMLGYNVEIGHMVAIGMIGSKSMMVKQVGYTACSVLFNEKSELLRLVIQTLKQDLGSNNDILQSMALVFIANMGNAEFAESLCLDVMKLLTQANSRAIVRKKAALALLRLFRKNPDCIPQEDSFKTQMMGLLDEGNIGVLTAVASLLLGLVCLGSKGYEEAVGKCTIILTKLCFADARNRSVYKYYNTICPWLQVKLFRILQIFPAQCLGVVYEKGVYVVSQDEAIKTASSKLHHVITELCNRTVMTKNVNKNNGDHSILFETFALVISMARIASSMKLSPPSISTLLNTVSTLLAKYIVAPDPNYRYLGLDLLTKLATIPDCLQSIRVHQSVILTALVDPDVSLRKRALDLLYAICDESNVEVVVAQMLEVLYNEQVGLRDDIVLKIVILAEKYNGKSKWYIDTIMELVSTGGQYLHDPIWFRIVQALTQEEQLQAFAVQEAYNRVADCDLPTNSVRLLSYILGEFLCKALEDDSIATTIDPETLFIRLHAQFRVADMLTKAIMLCAYTKMSFTLPEVKPMIDKILEQHTTSLDLEVQQRASEMLLLGRQDVSLLELVLDVMPPFEVSKDHILEDQITKNQSITDKIWTDGDSVENFGEADDEEDDDVATPHHQHEEEDHTANNSLEQREALLAPCLRGQDNIVYKSNAATMSCKVQVELGGVIKMILEVKNTSGAVMRNVKVNLPSSDAYKVQVKPATLESLGNGESTRFLLLWHVAKPFNGLPIVKYSYDAPHAASASPDVADIFSMFEDLSTTDVTTTLTVKLPFPAARLLVASGTNSEGPINNQTFLPFWKELGNQAIAKISASPQDSKLSTITALIPTILNAAIIPNCDKNPNNLYLSADFVSALKGQNQDFLRIPTLVRIETKPNSGMSRVTVNSASQLVSDAILQSIALYLNGKIVE